MKRPEPTEYPNWCANYIALVPETDIVFALTKQIDEIKVYFDGIDDERGKYAYADGKWKIKEVLGHLIDGERVFAYRAFRFSRGDEQPLNGFEENYYVQNSNYMEYSIVDLIDELVLIRRANTYMFKSMKESDWNKSGTASDNQISVRALAYCMAGHVRHHINILKERYGAA